MSKWLSHVKSTMKSNKGKSFSQVLKIAAKTYKKHGGGDVSPAESGALGGSGAAGTAAPAGGRRRSRRGRKSRRGTRRH